MTIVIRSEHEFTDLLKNSLKFKYEKRKRSEDEVHVSLIVVNGKSDVVGFCACIELVINPKVKVIVVIAIVIMNRFILFISLTFPSCYLIHNLIVGFFNIR